MSWMQKLRNGPVEKCGTARFIYNGHGKRHCVTVPLCTDAVIEYKWTTGEVTFKVRGRYLTDPWVFETVRGSNGRES